MEIFSRGMESSSCSAVDADGNGGRGGGIIILVTREVHNMESTEDKNEGTINIPVVGRT
jgi:hypothetical protein